ncbi:hypothetical protein LuPra_03367 [Luteitalea pratensis]|uniref:Uncharacterized protein n=1 Tax=Luteitalea pratensis TaxID=1855912 RepID=A0A143PQQ5_LUTPR|nr:hypothetical protein [Luteitalea pratensis]AMY10139.1 hypothetical protein LuPra_03367 [Luteitalea pratensis]
MIAKPETALTDVLEEAERYARTPAPSEPFSALVCEVMVPCLLAQRDRLARALLAAFPTFVAPRHQRPPTRQEID